MPTQAIGVIDTAATYAMIDGRDRLPLPACRPLTNFRSMCSGWKASRAFFRWCKLAASRPAIRVLTHFLPP